MPRIHITPVLIAIATMALPTLRHPAVSPFNIRVDWGFSLYGPA